ncbi:MAG: HNH endonuclease [Segetibacter sp.]
MGAILNAKALMHINSFINDYEIAANYHFDKIQRRTYLGQNIGHCRFCKESIPNVSFNMDAHTFPQFIGNKYLLSYYECDICNERFSRTLENEMANFMKLLHTTYGVKGENKIPTYKNYGIRFESSGTKLNIDNVDDSLLTGNLNDKRFSLDLITDKFIPIAVYKCLTKMALSIMPETEVSFFTNTFNWIKEDNHDSSEFKLNNLWIIFSQVLNEHLFPNISAILLKRKGEASISLPTYVFRLTYSKFSFQIYLPLCELDSKKIFSIQDLKYFPHLIDLTTGLRLI